MYHKKIYENVCWYCGQTVSTELCWKCPQCGWLICPACSHCKDMKSGGCPENKKGIKRYDSVLKKLNALKNMLDEHGCLTTPLFQEMRHIKTDKEYIKFKNKYKELIQKMVEEFRKDKEEKNQEKGKKRREESKEYVNNQRGYYKIIYQGPNFITYRKPNGVKETFRGNAKIIGNYIYIGNQEQKT